SNRGSNTVSVIDAVTNTVMAIIPVGNQPTSIEVNSSNNQIYVTHEVENTISVIDGLTNIVVATVPVTSPMANIDEDLSLE
ncbi:YncE family protein, partial [Priestia megaterium]|nr:YncE family protein [Priestia megaterium]